MKILRKKLNKKNPQCVHKMDKNEQKYSEIFKKIMNFTVFMYKSQKFAKGQTKIAQLHDGETVIFRNSAHNH